ncbi:AMP-binding protein [Streptomyces sp. DSM 15324]|uniref:AMP-binding protein n=1 Tax=Streptomyces sp. DSM 15324 TaxID=1739111 RepID=UPI001F3C5FE6|nr:AMP-binding protein [Streptomyces sp. DSM 15324]
MTTRPKTPKNDDARLEPQRVTTADGFASRYPERTAIVFVDDRITYEALDAAANRVANLLVSRGIQPGDKVALSCPERAVAGPRGRLPPHRLRREGRISPSRAPRSCRSERPPGRDSARGRTAPSSS